MPQFYHYTDDERAEKIIRSGRVMASLQSSGDAAFGNGVYLTKLKPGSSTRAQVARNNWLNTSHHYLKKTKNVFVLEIPDKEVENVSTKNRDIFLFGGRKDLRLVKYKWYLQDFDTGKIMASHKYQLRSNGPAAASSATIEKLMGDYVMTEETVNGRPVYMYQQPGYNRFLFMSSSGWWVVGRNTDKDVGCLKQKDKYSLGPDAEGAWEYGVCGADGKMFGKGDDATLKAYPWYMSSQWKTDFHSDSSVDPGSASTAVTPATDPTTRANTPSATASTLATPPATTTITSSTTASTPSINSVATASTTAITSPTASTPPSAVLSKSTATSSNVLDPDIDKVLQSPGSTRSGRVDGGPPGKKTSLRRRVAAMLRSNPFKKNKK